MGLIWNILLWTVVRSPASCRQLWFIKQNQTYKSFKENQMWNLSREKFATWNPSMHASLFPFIIFPKLNGVMHAFYFGVVSTQNIPLSRNLLSNWSEVGKVLTTSSLKVINYGLDPRPLPRNCCVLGESSHYMVFITSNKLWYWIQDPIYVLFTHTRSTIYLIQDPWVPNFVVWLIYIIILWSGWYILSRLVLLL